MRLRAILAAAAMLGGGVAQAAPSKVAVLELHDSAEVGDAAARFLAEQVRGAALGLPADSWFVMTRENLVALLPPGTDLSACADDCEITTGRAIGADVVVTGEVTRFGGAFKASLKAHRVASGQLVAQETATAATVEALDDAVSAAAARLFEAVRGPGAKVVAPALLKVNGTGGLMVFIDGVEVGLVPLGERRVGAGRHEIAVEGPCHQRVVANVDLAAAERRQVDLRPPGLTATLKVEVLDGAGKPTTGKVYVDEKPVGDAPGSFTVSACAKRVRVTSTLGSWRDNLALEAEGTAGITASLGGVPANPAIVAAIAVSPNDFQARRSAAITATLWGLGTGVVLTGIGAAMAYSNRMNGEELQKDPGNLELRKEVNSNHVASVTMYLLGGFVGGMSVVGLVGSLLMSDEPPPQSGLRFEIGPGSVGLEGSF
jgi:hypothetical protein